MLKIVGDMWDPNNWVEDDHEHRIYADETLLVYCIVSARWYSYLSQFKWSIHDRKKFERGYIYLRRTTHEGLGRSGGMYESEYTGKLVRDKKRIQRNKFLHTEIMELRGIAKPTPAHKEVDHKNRKTWDCTDENLQWATRGMNVRNSDLKSRWANGRNGGNAEPTRDV